MQAFIECVKKDGEALCRLVIVIFYPLVAIFIIFFSGTFIYSKIIYKYNNFIFGMFDVITSGTYFITSGIGIF